MHRCADQLGTFETSGQTITLQDRNDYTNIINLDATDDPYKVKNNVWIESPSEIALLKSDARNHNRAAYKKEKDQNGLVSNMSTHDELKDYFEAM